MTSNGKIQVIYGTPSDNPQKPNSVDNALEICSIELPPYLYFVEDASLSFLEHKRYQMKDIQVLENRIKNLEYYTSLSLLEKETKDLVVPPAGLKDSSLVSLLITLLTLELKRYLSITPLIEPLRC